MPFTGGWVGLGWSECMMAELSRAEQRTHLGVRSASAWPLPFSHPPCVERVLGVSEGRMDGITTVPRRSARTAEQRGPRTARVMGCTVATSPSWKPALHIGTSRSAAARYLQDGHGRWNCSRPSQTAHRTDVLQSAGDAR
jgi:hypothetical protein